MLPPMTTVGEKAPIVIKPLICLRDLSNYRDGTMPDSPDIKIPTMASSLSPVSAIPPVPAMARPLSTSSSLSGMNGVHSPHSSLNGRTPSPPSSGGPGIGQQLPPACGARQLSKLKRFLTTLMQFGSDISPEIGERVRSLVLGLVNSHLSIEEFHGKLQEATNFPLRPFVIPFLKANLPLLQRELLHCAHLAKQTPQQYLAHNEHILFDPARSPLDPQDIMAEFNENGKRRSPDRPKENGVDPHMDPAHPAKRPHTNSPGNGSRISPGSMPYANMHPSGGPMRMDEITMSREIRERELRERERIERERAERERHFPGYNFSRSEHFDHMERSEDDWKHVENMLHSIVGMVDRCKRAMAALQEKSSRDREELSMWMRRHSDSVDIDIKKRASEVMATTLQQAEDRVSEVKRRAEEAVNEVKRQAMAELQKAVAAAETKASQMVEAERAKMDKALSDARKQAQQEVISTTQQQEDSSESCWNCGRKASETCSGCNVARYCGSFCQHKDWENHHRVCGQTVAHSSSGSGGPSSSSTNSTNPKQESSLHSSTNSKEESKPKKVTAEKDAKKPEMPVTVTISPSQASPAAAPSPTDSTASSTKPGSRASSPTDTKAQVV